ncbi:MAG: NUDIX hydrolase [Acidobacteria bacterium]|nr:NUDIX hydrolase [Acidobacteriota bacterium]
MTNRRRARATGHEVIYQGRIFRIERDRVPLANGRTLTMEAVRHRGSVVLIAQPARGEIVLIRQFRYVVGRWLWELPAGSLEEGEPPARAARRECQEEIGLRPTRLRRLGTFYPSPGFCDERMIFYLCSGLVTPARPLPKDPDEQIEPRTLSVREAWTLVERGEIADMKTIVGLTLLDRL